MVEEGGPTLDDEALPMEEHEGGVGDGVGRVLIGDKQERAKEVEPGRGEGAGMTLNGEGQGDARTEEVGGAFRGEGE